MFSFSFMFIVSLMLNPSYSSASSSAGDLYGVRGELELFFVSLRDFSVMEFLGGVEMILLL